MQLWSCISFKKLCTIPEYVLLLENAQKSLNIRIVAMITEVHVGQSEQSYNCSLERSIIGRRKEVQIHICNNHVFFRKTLLRVIFIGLSDWWTNRPSRCHIIATAPSTLVDKILSDAELLSLKTQCLHILHAYIMTLQSVVYNNEVTQNFNFDCNVK